MNAEVELAWVRYTKIRVEGVRALDEAERLALETWAKNEGKHDEFKFHDEEILVQVSYPLGRKDESELGPAAEEGG